VPLIAFFDESGLHKPNGDLEWLVLGGAIASEENWLQVSAEWGDTLRDFNIPMPFHMVQFEFNKPPFDGLKKDEHKALLNRLLDIQSKYVKQIIGVTNWKRLHRGTFRKIYTKSLKDVLKTVAQMPTSDEISVVFARHRDVSPVTILDYFDDIKDGNCAFANCSTGEPADYPPLQMADLIAYELSRSMREGRPPRYPYLRMKASATVELFLLMEARGAAASSGRVGVSTA
jgi:Protein of unknown function (DUF3800)